MSAEKRQNPRINVKWKARVLLPDRSLFEIPIRNASIGGVGVAFPYVLKTNFPVNIEFYVPVAGEMKRIRAKTKVVFNAALANGDAQLGLKFVQISDHERQYLAEAIKKLVG